MYLKIPGQWLIDLAVNQIRYICNLSHMLEIKLVTLAPVILYGRRDQGYWYVKVCFWNVSDLLMGFKKK